MHSQSPEHCPKCVPSSTDRGAEARLLQHATPSPVHLPDQAHVQAEEAHADRSPSSVVSGSSSPLEMRADVDISTPGPKQPSIPVASAQDMHMACSEAQRRVPVFMGFSPAKVKPSAVMAPPVPSCAVLILAPLCVLPHGGSRYHLVTCRSA